MDRIPWGTWIIENGCDWTRPRAYFVLLWLFGYCFWLKACYLIISVLFLLFIMSYVRIAVMMYVVIAQSIYRMTSVRIAVTMYVVITQSIYVTMRVKSIQFQM